MEKNKDFTSLVENTKRLQDEITQNLLLEREAFRRRFDPRRDMDKECGYPVVLMREDYKRLYERGDIASHVVDIWPEECWSEPPSVYETEDPEDTEFEKQWKELERKFALYPWLDRADRISGIGRFGIILIGTDDGLELDQPIPGYDQETGKITPTGNSVNLLYLRVFDETVVDVLRLEQNVNSARYGFPTAYMIRFEETAAQGPEQAVLVSRTVHWTRLIHVADNRRNSEIYGEPRLKKVVNRILDTTKVAGGSAEMFWKGGFPGLSLETLPEVLTGGAVELDLDETKKQLEAYMNGLQRYIATSGMKANSLSVQVADPSPQLDVQLKLIASAISVPWRIFIGSEAGQLASEQDTRTWNRRIGRRRNNYVTPCIILPFINRLIEMGVMKAPESGNICVEWNDLNTPSDADRATVAEGMSNAIVKYVASGASEFIPPFHFLTLVLGLSDDEAQSVIEDAGLDGRAIPIPAQAGGQPGPGETPAAKQGKQQRTRDQRGMNSPNRGTRTLPNGTTRKA